MRKLNKFIVTVLTILMLQLIADWVVTFFNNAHKNKYLSVLIYMAVIVILFYPMLTFLNRYIATFSKKYVKGSGHLSKNKYVGVLVGFFIALLILFSLFAILMFDKSLFSDISRWIGSLFH